MLVLNVLSLLTTKALTNLDPIASGNCFYDDGIYPAVAHCQLYKADPKKSIAICLSVVF